MPSRIQAAPTIQQQLASRGITEKTGVFGQHKVQLGTGSPIRLDKIKGNSVPYQGFRTATKIARGHEGLEKSSSNTLNILAAPGTLDARKLLAALKTNGNFMERLDKLGQLTEAQKGNSLWSFAPAVEKLSNTELAAVYQNFTSAEMDLLQTALRHEGLNNPKANDARHAASQLFDLQALVLKEMSNRVSNGMLDDLSAKEPENAAKYENMRPASLSRQYAQKDVLPTAHTHDITAANLHTLANVAAESATRRENTATAETQKLSSRGISATPKEMGDLLRESPLTINLPARRLLRDNSFILNPDQPMPNAFHIQQQGTINKGASYMPRRNETEKLLFPELKGHDVIADERPVYGALNTQRAQKGPAKRDYGHCVIVLKPEVARRATFIAEDTFYSPAISITPERKEEFYKLLDGSGLPIETVVALKDPESAEHRAMETYLDGGLNVKDVTATFFKNPPTETGISGTVNKDLFAAVALQAFGDKAATRSKVASYDNLESLLPNLNDLNGAMLAQGAEKRARGEDPSVRLSMNYIEAQIHGPIIPSRDIQEIRVDLGEAPAGERMQLIARMDTFSHSTGVKVTYITDELNEWETSQSLGTFELTDQNEEERIDNTFESGVRYFTDHVRQEVNDAIEEGLNHNIQNHIRSALNNMDLTHLFPQEGEILRRSALTLIAKAIPRQVQTYMATPSNENTSPEKIAADIIERAAQPVLQKKADLLNKLNNLPMTSEQRAAFSHWIRSSDITDPEELQLTFDNAQIQAAALQTIAKADPPLSAEETFRTLAKAAQLTDERTDTYAKGKDYSAEQKFAAKNRASFMAYSLIKNGIPPLSQEQMRGLYDRLHSPEMLSMIRQLRGIVTNEAIMAEVNDYGLLNTLSTMSIFHLQNAEKEVGEKEVDIEFNANLALVPEKNRALFREVAPQTMATFDKAYPAYSPFPAAAVPGSMPTTHTARRDFLVRHINEYLSHEKGFDRGSSTHGRGHITRAFIFASVMCSILEEQGIPVDRNAVLCGITGYDVGRQGPGVDKWEKDSAQTTVKLMKSDFGQNTMGQDYEQEVIGTITKHSTTVEGMVLKAADGLDIGRTKTFDLNRMPFLRGKEGEDVPDEVKKLREGLAKEADLLQRFTDPMCQHREELNKLIMDITTTAPESPLYEQLIEQKEALLKKIAELYEASWPKETAQVSEDTGADGQAAAKDAVQSANMADNALFATGMDANQLEAYMNANRFVENIEKIIQTHSDEFPILSKYYR